MPKYEVIIKQESDFVYTITAVNKEEAKQKALDEFHLDIDNNDWGNIQDSNHYVEEVSLIDK